MLTLNFKCSSCQRRYQLLIDSSTKVVDCECGGKALRQLSAPKFVGNSCGNNASWR